MIQLYFDNNKVDVYEGFNVNMTYQQTDISAPEAKLNNYSKTISLYGTPNNNRIFGLIFNFNRHVTQSKTIIGAEFNPSKRVPFTIVSNGDIYDTGYAQLDKVSIDKGVIKYDMTLYGGIGAFFYGLKMNDNGEEKTLANMYYGFNVNNGILSKTAEASSMLFEYNKEFIEHCWDVRMNNFSSTDDNSIFKALCPIPCHQGFYDNFNSDTFLVHNSGFGDDNILTKAEYDTDQQEFWASYKDTGWNIAKVERELSSFEAHDLRSHYMPCAVRLKTIYDAIKDPYNNGGFTVDDTNINDIEKRYIDEAYMMMDLFNWDEINAENTYTSLEPTFSSSDILYSRPALSSLYDLSDYDNPNANIYITPEISFDESLNAFKSRIGAQAYRYLWHATASSAQYEADITIKGIGGSTLQYFYANVLNEDDEIVSTSDLYIYSDNSVNPPAEEDNKEGVLASSYDINALNAMAASMTMEYNYEVISHILLSNGKKLKQSKKQRYKTLWPKMPDSMFISDNSYNAVDINFSHVGAGYDFIEDSDNKNLVGKEIILKVSLPKDKVKIAVVGKGVTATGMTTPDDSYSLNQWPADVTSVGAIQYIESPASYKKFEYSKDIVKHGSYYADVYYTTINGVSHGHISVSSQIYNGSADANSEMHTLDKRMLFYNTKSPYDYLISMAKIFNWKFEADYYDKKVIIYSANKFFVDKIEDIDDKVDRSAYEIIPTTAASKSYIFKIPREDTYAGILYNKKNAVDYGTTIKNTGYEFNDEPYDIFNSISFKTAIDYTMHSLYFNEGYDIPALGKNIVVSLFMSGDDGENSEDFKRHGQLANDYNLSQQISDSSSRPALFDGDMKNVSNADTLLVYKGIDDFNGIISDNFAAQGQIAGGNCYIYGDYSSIDEEHIVDADNGIYGTACIVVDEIPAFGTSNDVVNISMSGDNSIYDNCWKNYVDNIYDNNNKIITIKYALTEKPYDAMRKYYTFDGGLFILNKICDYNPENKLTKCEFIQVQYTHM